MKRKKRKEKNVIYRFTMMLMVCLIAALLYLINDKTHLITTTSIQNFKLGDLSKLMFWENMFTQKESETVSSQMNYTLLKDNYYANGSNSVSAMMDGVVIKVEKDSVLQLCDNGVSISYEKMKSVNVKKDERILSGDDLGSMDNSVILHFYVNDKEISKDKALSIK